MSGLTAVTVQPPTFEQHHDGFGVQCARPRISWRFSCVNERIRNWAQTAYEIEISTKDGEDSRIFKVLGNDSVLVPWPSPESLASRACRIVRVRCHGRYALPNGHEEESKTEWSSPSQLEIALLANSDWTARMITISEAWPLSADGSARPLCFHKSFCLPLNRGAVHSARLYITSHGVYNARMNGTEIGDHVLSPGFQSFHKRLHYQIYDVTHLVTSSGPNKIEVEVAAGWFASAWTWARKRFIYGQKLGVLAQLEIHFEDTMAPFKITTDESWSSSMTALVTSEIYDGETYDQRLSTNANPDDHSVQFSVQESPIPVSRLISPEAAPVRVVDRIEPKDIFKSRSGRSVIVDFGQNFAGRVCVRRVQKPCGSSITLRHAEVIQDGELVYRPLRTVQARDTIISDGNEIVNWHPKYTFHGFRYVEVTGWSPDDEDCPLTQSSIVGEVLHTDMVRTGWFSCSNSDVNRLHENSLWGMKSNFLSVPIECPSRDERMGWTGDLNIFAPTANFLYDTSGILRHWLDDLYLDQIEESPHWRKGVVPLFIPNNLLRKDDDKGSHGWDPMPNAVWGDAAIMVPWQLYYTFGDLEFLSRQYDSMVQYLRNGVVRGQDGLWDPEQWQFGDWLDPRAPQNDSGRGTTDGTFIADCFLIQSTRIIAKIACLLDRSKESAQFNETALQLAGAWRKKYLTPSGYVLSDTATALSLALSFDLISDSNKDKPLNEQAASRLSRVVRLNDFKITTGFVGSAYLSRALTKTGNSELSYAMLFQKKCPSYLYPVTMGATTSWERWDSMLSDGSINPGSMTSFNHHALGSIAHWLHADVGGLEAIDPGWKLFRVRPRPNREIMWAEAVFESRYGRIELRWTLDGEDFRLTLRVPPNSSAVIIMPLESNVHSNSQIGGREQRVGSGLHVLECRFVQTNWPPKALLPPWGRAEF